MLRATTPLNRPPTDVLSDNPGVILVVMTVRLPSSLVATELAMVVVVVACAGTSGARPSWLVSHHLGEPKGVLTVGVPGSGARDAVLRSGASRLEIVTWGSSGCPRLPVRMLTSAANTVSVTMSDGAAPAGTTCTADLAPTTSVIQLPGTLDVAQPVGVAVVDGVFGISLTLPAPQSAGA